MKVLYLIIGMALLLPLCVTANQEHDIHLSMCELRYNEQSATFEVAIKVFIDDLEMALKNQGVTNLRIGASNESDVADEHIGAYLHQQFTVDVNGQKITPVFIGKEVAEDMIAVWCYLEYKTDATRASKCTFTNRVLLEVHPDQRNIMDIRMGRSHKDYTILDSSHPAWSYTF